MKKVFTYNGPYNDDLLSDIIKTYTNVMGVEIDATLTETSDPTLRYMKIVVQAPKENSTLDQYEKHNKIERLVPRYPKPNSNLGA